MYGLHVPNIVGYSVNVSFKQNKRTSKVYIDDGEIKDLIRTVGDAGCILFNYYVTKSSIRNFGYTDDQAADKLGWDLSKVKRIRLKLKKVRWIDQSVSKDSSGDKYLHTFLSREKVAEKFGVVNSYWNDKDKLAQVYEKFHLTSLSQFFKNSAAREYYEELL